MDKKLQAGYEMTLKEFRFEFSRGAAYTCIALILLGIGLDYSIYPEMILPFAAARVAASIVIYFIILTMETQWGKAWIQWLTFAWLLQPQIMIAGLIGATTGATSIYYSGLTLAMYASGIVLAFGLWQNIVFGGLTVLLYAAACLYASTHLANQDNLGIHGPFAVNSLLLVMAAVLSAVYTNFNERARLQLFRLKAEVAEKNVQLEQMNKDLANIKGQMLQQEKMAAIGTLAAGLLHEVNNPVNYCLMALDIAREEPAAKNSATLNECLMDARQGMQRIQHIVSDLKTFAYRKQDTSAEGGIFLFERAVDAAQRLVSHETKGITITRDLPADTLVRGDEAAIIGVLINLYSNAVLAMRTSKCIAPAIHLFAAWNGDRLHVTVQDNGPGIPPENLSRVFEPFFTTREIGKGLGLGLSISYSVIEQRGGVLHAESEVGKWTKMIFDLPRAS